MGAESDTSPTRPFIIWTLQRTGGTNLTSKLVELSGLLSPQHEPFNRGRKYGEITEDWSAFGDRAKLDASIEAIVATGCIIKHCVETVPWEISESLAQTSTRAGYRHIFLYRRNALDRLLSLHFATLTGIWGPAKTAKGGAEMVESELAARKESVVESALSHELPVEQLVKHERNCVRLLTRLWMLLSGIGAKPAQLAFEDLYQSGDRESLVSLLGPFAGSGSASYSSSLLRDWLEGVTGGGSQGTRDKYNRFPRFSDLATQLRSVKPFSPSSVSRELQWRDLSGQFPWVCKFFVDVLPKTALPDRDFDIGGVLVIDVGALEVTGIYLVGEKRSVPLHWGQSSRNMAKEFPQARNSEMARWSGTAVFADGEQRLLLRLLGADGQVFSVGEILLH